MDARPAEYIMELSSPVCRQGCRITTDHVDVGQPHLAHALQRRTYCSVGEVKGVELRLGKVSGHSDGCHSFTAGNVQDTDPLLWNEKQIQKL